MVHLLHCVGLYGVDAPGRIPTYVTDHSPPTSHTDRQTDRRHAIARPRLALKCIAW